MKVSKEKVLFKVLTGSRLYGTFTSESDYDYKAVVLPPLETLLMNIKVTNRKEKPEGKGQNSKMLAGETETEYLPLQVFLDDFFAGQTYAIEVAFAAAQGLTETKDPFVEVWMKDMIDRFLTKNVKKMVGYAVSQSKVYGLKTERFKAIKDAVRLIEEYAQKNSLLVDLHDAFDLRLKLTELPFVKPTMIENSRSGSELVPALEICEKKFSLTNKIDTMYLSLKKSLDSYGSRVASFEGEGVDWKALSHAIRITSQVIELSETGSIVFPNKQAEVIKLIKQGLVPLDEATELLELFFSNIDAAVESSVLKERTPEMEEDFYVWKRDILIGLYGHEMLEYSKQFS